MNSTMGQETRDANSFLVELDRGLQSFNVGDQCEAVVRFTNLFKRHQAPLLVNSAFLKLAEAFRVGTNFIRIQVCEVFERNQSQLSKVHSVDDLFRSLFSVTTSNDPIARSITLLALGHIAPIVGEYKSIHHCISSSFDSNIEYELNATIICAASFVQHSAEFACNIYPKIVSIIDSKKSSAETRLRALTVLDHGFYNANDAMVVRSFLIEVVEKTNMKKLICASLTLSTKISHNSLSHITAQIELLLKIFMNDTREVIKSNALRNLLFLAQKSPHIWECSHIDPLVSYLEQTIANSGQNNFDKTSIGSILALFCKILTCKCNFISQQEKDRIYQLCYKLTLDDCDLTLCPLAFELLTVKSEEAFYSATKFEYMQTDHTNTLAAIKTFLAYCSPKSSKSRHADHASDSSQQQVGEVKNSNLKTVYRHIVKLCILNAYCSEILKLVFNKISARDASLVDLCPYYTELMCAISQFSQGYTVTPDSCWKIIKSKNSDLSETNLLNICVLYFQALRMSPKQEVPHGLVDKLSENRSIWFSYKVMRQAMRYGHFKIAGLLCEQLHQHVTTDTIDSYFKSLGRICAAETILSQSSDLDNNLKKALPLYEDSVSPLRASFGVASTLNFQLQYLWLRIRTLQVHASLRQCCKTFEIIPITCATLLNSIGAVRSGANKNNDQGMVHLGSIQQMLKIAKDFRHLADCYENLSSVSTGSDHRTLDYLYLLKSSNIIMANTIDAVFQYGKNLHVMNKLSLDSDKKLALEHCSLDKSCNSFILAIKYSITTPGIFPSEKTIKPFITIFETFSEELLRGPFSYPRYFFQDSNKRSCS